MFDDKFAYSWGTGLLSRLSNAPVCSRGSGWLRQLSFVLSISNINDGQKTIGAVSRLYGYFIRWAPLIFGPFGSWGSQLRIRSKWEVTCHWVVKKTIPTKSNTTWIMWPRCRRLYFISNYDGSEGLYGEERRYTTPYRTCCCRSCIGAILLWTGNHEWGTLACPSLPYLALWSPGKQNV